MTPPGGILVCMTKDMNNDWITQYILSMGLALPLAILVAFRAGRLRGFNPGNMEERLGDLAFDSVKEQICNKLIALFNLFMNMPNGQDLRFPGRLTIQQVASHIHDDVEDLTVLQNVYFDLIHHGVQSPYFMQALEYVLSM